MTNSKLDRLLKLYYGVKIDDSFTTKEDKNKYYSLKTELEQVLEKDKRRGEPVSNLRVDELKQKADNYDSLTKYPTSTEAYNRLEELEQENKRLKEDLDLCHKVLDLKIQKLEKIREWKIKNDNNGIGNKEWNELKQILEEKQ